MYIEFEGNKAEDLDKAMEILTSKTSNPDIITVKKRILALLRSHPSFSSQQTGGLAVDTIRRVLSYYIR